LLHDEILTIQELASLLKMSRSQVYDLTRRRAQLRNEIPLPVLRINSNLRFRKSDVDAWLERLADQGRSAA